MNRKPMRGRSILRGAAALVFLGMLGYGSYQAMLHPDTPLPREWNPVQPLLLTDPVTPLTGWKLNRAAANAESCLAALGDGAVLQQLADVERSAQCHIRDRVALQQVGTADVPHVETRCAVALRLAMWERHSLQPAARDLLGTSLTGMEHIGSYNCRPIRSENGISGRMSAHATAEAIDISGFRFADGRAIDLITGWDGGGPEAAFLRAARDGSCDWFSTTLSPDYNKLHADHFHLQSRGRGLCR